LGGYLALGGSYAVESARNFSVGTFTGLSGNDPGLSGNGSAAGWSGVGALGYNSVFGPALVGIELDGRWGNETFDKSAAVPNPNGFSLPGGQIAYSYRFKNDAGVHLSGRIGAAFGDILIFGKFGAGASRLKETFSADQTGAFRCANFGVGPCATGGAASFTQTRWVPSLIVGVGAERNLGAFFARGAVDVEMLTQDVLSVSQLTTPLWSFTGNASSPNAQWTVRASAMGGIRF